MKRFGIIGFGLFGQLAARHLRDHFSVVVTDTADVGEAAAAIGVKTGSLADAADCDVVMLAVPVQAMAATIAAIAPLVRPGALVLDVASVKMLPARWMLEALPESVDIVATDMIPLHHRIKQTVDVVHHRIPQFLQSTAFCCMDDSCDDIITMTHL